MSRFFHNLTSQYNIYYNGLESYREGIDRITSSNRDDYSMIMPLFEYSNPDAAQSASSDMERAIQKCSKLISLHSITAKPEIKNNEPLSEKEKEFIAMNNYNNWVDDSYLLMGKAQLILRRNEEARITLMYNLRESNDRNVKDETSIWLSRIYADVANYNEASRVIEEIETASMADELLPDYYLTLSDIQLKQGRFEAAADHLDSALKNMKGKREKARLTYILARLHEATGNTIEAEISYRKVLRLNPPYEMEFNARINQAGVFDVETGDTDEIEKELKKLLKDEKNKEYKDQIYYAMGNLFLREGKIEDAVEYMKLSASAASSNTTQKGRSYLILGIYYFNQRNYRESFFYYDSAVVFLPADFPGYPEIYERTVNLTELEGNLYTIEREDSLQYVASLPVPQRDLLITGIIQKIEQEERLSETQGDQMYNMGEFYENQRRYQGNVEASGKWYFYNQAALTFGRTEFRNKWGERGLEDNWRRINRSRISTNLMQEEMNPGVVADTSAAATNRKSREFYLRDLPLTDSLVTISNDHIADALYNAGRIFQEKIPDIEQSNNNYSSFLSRFPGHEYVPQALYNLYYLNLEADPALSESYKNRLIADWPGTEFAMILSDPEYFNNRLAKERESEELYNEAYAARENENMELAIALCDRGISQYPESELIPMFRLLRVYSMARTTDERTLKVELLKISADFPGTDQALRAAEMVEYLNREIPELKVEEEQAIAREIYNTDLTGEHYFIVIVKTRILEMNRLTFDVINYNIDNYTNENFSSRGALINNSYIMISVGPFTDRDQAAGYYNKFQPREILKNTDDIEIIMFIISSPNMEVLIEDEDPDRYFLFFRENYTELK